MICLFSEHICSYLAHMFRVRDIRLNGKPDVNGVLGAKREKVLFSIE